jgi:hypothetical protein
MPESSMTKNISCENELIFLAPLRGALMPSLVTGGLRYAATTGYYLLALRAKIRGLYLLNLAILNVVVTLEVKEYVLFNLRRECRTGLKLL